MDMRTVGLAAPFVVFFVKDRDQLNTAQFLELMQLAAGLTVLA